jgi:DMSO reductase anchor subunit
MSSSDEAGAIPSGLTIFGCMSLAVVTPFTLRYVYEQTILTWRDGWQMVGFFLAPLHPSSCCSALPEQYLRTFFCWSCS